MERQQSVSSLTSIILSGNCIFDSLLDLFGKVSDIEALKGGPRHPRLLPRNVRPARARSTQGSGGKHVALHLLESALRPRSTPCTIPNTSLVPFLAHLPR